MPLLEQKIKINLEFFILLNYKNEGLKYLFIYLRNKFETSQFKILECISIYIYILSLKLYK